MRSGDVTRAGPLMSCFPAFCVFTRASRDTFSKLFATEPDFLHASFDMSDSITPPEHPCSTIGRISDTLHLWAAQVDGWEGADVDRLGDFWLL